MKKIGILLSGGIDSTALLYHMVLGKKFPELLAEDDSVLFYPIFINYGQGTAREEIKAACNVLSWFSEQMKNDDWRAIDSLLCGHASVGSCTLRDDDCTYPGKHPAYVPYRNLLLLSLGLSLTEIRRPTMIVMGVHNIDVVNHFPDCSIDFEEAMQNMVNLYNPVKSHTSCQIKFPFLREDFKSKKDIMDGVPADLLALCASGYGTTLAAQRTTPENTRTHV